MKFIWIAADPQVADCDKLWKELSEVVQRHNGRVANHGSFLQPEDFRPHKRFGLGDLARACRISMAQVEIPEP